MGVDVRLVRRPVETAVASRHPILVRTLFFKWLR